MNERTVGMKAQEEDRAFLSGGGLTGEELRAHDWSASSLGVPERWPEALKIILATMLSSPQPMFMAWGPDLASFFNDAYRPILGQRVTRGSGVPFADLWSDVWRDIEPIVRRTLEGEGCLFQDLPLTMTRNGFAEATWWSFSYMPLRDQHGAVRGMFCVTTETTDRVRASSALKESEERNRQILDSAIDYAIVAIDLDGRVTRWNEGARHVLGWTEEDMVGEPADRFFTPEDVAEGRIATEMHNAVTTGRGNDERWHLRKNGERFWAVGEMTVLRNQAGEATGFVKVLRDRTDDHRDQEQLQEMEASLRRAQEAGGVGVFSVGVEDGMLRGSPAFCRLFGVVERERIPAEEFERLIVAEDVALVTNRDARLKGEADLDVEYRIRRADTGEERWLSRKGEFEHGADRRPLRFVGVVRDITDQVAARRQLEGERARMAQMFGQAPSFMAMLNGPEHVFEFVNPAYLRLVGERELIGRTVADALPEAVAQGYLDLLDGVHRSGKVFSTTGARFAVEALSGGAISERYLDFVYQPILDEAGAVTGIFVEGSDVTERVEAEAELREALGLNTLVLASSRDCIVVLDLEGNTLFVSPGGIEAMDVKDVDAILGLSWLRVWKDEDHEAAQKAVAEAAAGGIGRFQGFCPTHAGTPKWWDVVVSPLPDANGRPERLVSVGRDITEQRMAEGQRNDLMREMSHRMKNMLSMVQAITTQTLRQSTSIEEGRTAITGRVAALARAQDILIQSGSTPADIRQVVDEALSPHQTSDRRIDIVGPPAELQAQQGLGLSLALHELATNAAKYGALSNDAGRVLARWDVTANGGFTLDWIETGGPAVEPPARTGFGSKLVERMVAPYFDGTAELEFHPAGVRFHLTGVLGSAQDAAS